MKNSFASLSPTLLARKGGARPAMRSQLQPLRPLPDSAAGHVEDDLGWNDMGHAPDPVQPRRPETKSAAPEPAIHQAEIVPLNRGEAMNGGVPAVVRQRESAAAQLGTGRRSALADGRRAAFTLRLDSERHLKLRLASVAGNRSAQQIVTEALDRLLADLPDLDTLADQLRKRS